MTRGRRRRNRNRKNSGQRDEERGGGDNRESSKEVATPQRAIDVESRPGENARGQTERNVESKQQRVSLLFEGIIAVCAVIGTIATVVGVLLLWFELNELGEGNVLTRNAIVVENRASVLPIAPPILKLVPMRAGYTQDVNIQNFGNVAATELTARIADPVILRGKLPDCARTPTRVPYSSTGLIAPGTIWTVYRPMPELDEETVRELKAKRWFLYFYGRLEYLDGFDTRRTTAFCFIHTGDMSNWKFCENNNWIDEAKECKKAAKPSAEPPAGS